ncbi:uncharacterized protein LTR77_003116 [Saxophila tyrrhenica]|uniref:Zn(2)-C6 fungal-type domain-containing protein n=1 Tax=Saxophila tyrrhenica TaxID=1690608 RepID=A0AAV9PGH7_9PEZI|nr:hypothetical protein LTR77_003116 [Saxophila tyrrhenica]
MDNWMYAASFNDNSSSGATPAENASNNNANLSAFRDSTSPDSSARNAQAHQQRIRRRNRLITSCLECRRRKLKCDKTAPCTNCTRFKRDCLYLASSADPSSQQKLADIKEKMGALEKSLEREIAAGQQAKMHLGGANVRKSSAGEAALVHVEGDEEDEAAGEDEEGLEPTPLASLDNVYEDNADDELMDLGVQMGKMRISERIGGWIRPKLVEELTDTLEDVKGGKSRHSQSPMAKDHFDLRPGQPQPRIQASPKSYIGPGPDYIAPASSFFFPGTNMNTSLIDYLPTKNVSDQLIAQYFAAVHLVARAVHRPTFEAQYALFWGQIATGTEPVPSHQAIIFAAMLSAAVSLSDEQVSRMFGTTKAALVDSLRSGTEMALSKANFLRTTKTDTMQAFVMYLIPLIRAEVSRAHSALVGTAIRLAECMGLHRDGTYYNMSPIDVQVRRLIWHQLCFLDMRTCEATGPRPQIRKDDYDTKFPLNVNDVDLLSDAPPTEDRPYWTDMTIFRIRCECVDLRRQCWFDIVQIDKKKKTLTSSLVKIQKTRSQLTEKYLPMVDESVPVQAYGKHVLIMGLNACFVQVLHRYLFSTTQRMPDRLRQILIEAGVAVMENAIAVETKRELAPWVWYKGALNQFHQALLLMVEVYAYPMRKDAARIWKCLDYIFDIPPHLSPKQKAELVITDLRDRMQVFHEMRKVRTTTQMEERVVALKESSHRDPMASNLSTLADTQASGPPFTQQLGYQTVGGGLLPASFSPPPAEHTESSGSGSRQGSVQGQSTGDIQMNAMEDIDWNEWDKYFNPLENTGDINIPNFNIEDFTGYNSQAMDPMSYNNTNVGGFNIPSAQDLADVNFTQTFVPNSNQSFPRPHY